MAKYNKEQSAIIALWNLALNYGYQKHGYVPLKDSKAPSLIFDLVNKLGESHSAESIALHSHGYDQLFHDRDIDRGVTGLQNQIAKELSENGTVQKVYLKN
ncbi:TPA: hypothetical protein ACMDNH_003559 [Vibrio cholerae]|uniref:hypothetical protein n=1 Tax=Vibrio cholerae TaxID=666 RepID=UPI0004852CCD|nr:hypothetical protein [Vibrio cholerae]EJL6325717.1 hypothetical protein [Vibrio cholerae]EJL6770186.1 hypothetical protein [Vibrio cholerae]EKF9208419.1 hypothetical protein [Vibrio cholerae]EKF9628213.1 hypothetical protein [Vibrio cholerae]EKF9648225.1 hypothetical protein [Vibrio cholerae]